MSIAGDPHEMLTRRNTLVAVLVLAVLVIVACAAERRYDSYMAGYWVGDAAFLQQAGLLDLQLFVAPRRRGSPTRDAYLVMTDSRGEFLANQALTIREGSWPTRVWAALRATTATRDNYRLPHVRLEYAEGVHAPTPTTLALALSMHDGTLTLYEKGQSVFAFAHKDLATSAGAVAAYAGEADAVRV